MVSSPLRGATGTAPKCQTNAREKGAREALLELLPASYFHLVFSVPHALVPLMWQNQRRLFSFLFESSAATLLEVAADPNILPPRSVSSPSFSPGDKPSSPIFISTASRTERV
jgi:hypothetical protein